MKMQALLAERDLQHEEEKKKKEDETKLTEESKIEMVEESG
jgi:hypothetical protein